MIENKDGKIYITISDKRDGGGEGDKSSELTTPKKNSLAKFTTAKLADEIMMLAKKSIDIAINNVGFLEGNYLEQKNIQGCMNVLNSIASIGQSAALGFLATGSPIGAVIGAGINTITQVVNVSYELFKLDVENKRQNHSIDMLRIRSGLDSTTNNSRTGN